MKWIRAIAFIACTMIEMQAGENPRSTFSFSLRNKLPEERMSGLIHPQHTVVCELTPTQFALLKKTSDQFSHNAARETQTLMRDAVYHFNRALALLAHSEYSNIHDESLVKATLRAASDLSLHRSHSLCRQIEDDHKVLLVADANKEIAYNTWLASVEQLKQDTSNQCQLKEALQKRSENDHKALLTAMAKRTSAYETWLSNIEKFRRDLHHYTVAHYTEQLYHMRCVEAELAKYQEQSSFEALGEFFQGIKIDAHQMSDSPS